LRFDTKQDSQRSDEEYALIIFLARFTYLIGVALQHPVDAIGRVGNLRARVLARPPVDTPRSISCPLLQIAEDVYQRSAAALGQSPLDFFLRDLRL
jgi:hypothetical protein